MASQLVATAEALRALHVPGDPVVLANVWDAATATAVEAAGFPAIATSSLAIAHSLGYEDGQDGPPEEMFAAIARVTRVVSVPVTADIERGYQLPASEIVDRLLAAGAVGCNLEDSDPATQEMVDVDEQAGLLREVRAAASSAGVPIVINARIDLHLRDAGDEASRMDAAIERATRYLEAGADCVYPIHLSDATDVKTFVEGVQGHVNVNATFLAGCSLSDFAAAGVARVSFGGGLHTASVRWFEARLKDINEGRVPYER